MKGFDVLKIKSAVKSHNKFDLSHSHLTTMDFGQIVPLLVEETVPGDKFSINAEYFSRMAPLVKPTYGKFNFKTVNAFVPYHQIAVDADAWLAGKTTWEGQTPRHRYITMQTLHTFVKTRCIDASPGYTVDGTNCDYSYKNSSGTAVYGVFTAQGKYWVKVLNALGYALPQGVSEKTSDTWYTTMRNVKLSAYPLLAFAKLYNDYMSQSQRFNTSALSDLLYKIKYNITYTGFYTASNGEVAEGSGNAIMNYILLNYENDYFTSAWQNPNAALSGTESITTATYNNTAAGTMQVESDANNQAASLTSLNKLTQRALDFLKSFDNWVRRNNYSGSRAVQQVYSRFGIKTDDYKSHYAEVISVDSLPIQVGDVTATADATNVPLGDYAGKGIMSGAKGFTINVSDYGVIFVLGYFTVSPMMSFGFDRRVLRNNPLDYYNPEFDGLGADAITAGEVWASPIVAGTSDTTLDNAVYGFTERYNAYRYGRDVITGEFRNYHPDGDMNTWHTGRNLAAIRALNNMVAQSSSMNTLPQTDSEYNRIFSVTSDSVDHFYLTCRFNISAIRPMMNLNQVVNLGEGDTLVPRNGNVIS